MENHGSRVGWSLKIIWCINIMIIVQMIFLSDGWDLFLTERGSTKATLIRRDKWLCRCPDSGIFLAPRRFEISGERRDPRCGFKGRFRKGLYEFYKRETTFW